MSKRAFCVMFHHLHTSSSNTIQGSLDANDFVRILDYLKNQYNLISASEWVEKALSDQLDSTDVCISFDDSLKCQYDIGRPILDRYSINAMWGIYTSVFTDKIEYIEVFRCFRSKCYSNIDEFYKVFFEAVEKIDEISFGYELNSFREKAYLAGYKFYSENDRLYRYLRDKVLTNDQYRNIYFGLMDLMKFDIDECLKEFSISKESVKTLAKNGHVITLHSHSHPTNISDYSKEEQYNEYLINQNELESIIGSKPEVVTYPSGSFNDETPEIMEKLSVRVGFCSNMNTPYNSTLFFPRMDCADLLSVIDSSEETKVPSN